MDNKNLGKLKYIYKIYMSINKIAHCERYPVIYINDEYCYYKDSGKKLEYISTSRIQKQFSSSKDLKISKFGLGTYYFTKLNSSFNSEKITLEVFKEKYQEKLEAAKQSVQRATKSLDQEKAKLKTIESNIKTNIEHNVNK